MEGEGDPVSDGRCGSVSLRNILEQYEFLHHLGNDLGPHTSIPGRRRQPYGLATANMRQKQGVAKLNRTYFNSIYVRKYTIHGRRLRFLYHQHTPYL